MPLHRDKFVTSQRASNHLLLKQFTVVWKKLFSVILPIIFYSIQESPQPDVSTNPFMLIIYFGGMYESGENV